MLLKKMQLKKLLRVPDLVFNYVLFFQVEVKFDNGHAYSLSAEYLRIYSPAVDSKIRSIRGEKVNGWTLLYFQHS